VKLRLNSFNSLIQCVKNMKTLEEIKSILAEHKEELKEKYKVKEIEIFGSFVKG